MSISGAFNKGWQIGKQRKEDIEAVNKAPNII